MRQTGTPMIRVARFPDSHDDCGWWHLQGPADTYPAVAADLSVDYAIVGAGWTGLAAARRLGERLPDATIALLDAERVGFGAAGRNSGFLFDLPFVFPADAFQGREDEGRREIALYRAVVDHMRAFVEAGNVACGWLEIGQYHVAAGERGERDLALIEAGLRRLGEPHSVLGPAEIGKALGTQYYRRAIRTPGTVQIDPCALARAYAAALPENVQVFERSPVTGIDSGTQPRIRTAAGDIRAGKVLLTTNAFLGAFSGVKPRLVPVMTFAGMTEPSHDEAAAGPAGTDPWGVVPASLFGTSMRRLQDGRLLVRNTYTYAPELAATTSMRARAQTRQDLSLRRRFPDRRDIRWQWRWGGVVSFFRGANGYFGTVAPNTVAAVTSGMPVCILYGQQLAEYASGGGGDALDFVQRRSTPAALPPKPLVGMAARLAAGLGQRRAGQEI